MTGDDVSATDDRGGGIESGSAGVAGGSGGVASGAGVAGGGGVASGAGVAGGGGVAAGAPWARGPLRVRRAGETLVERVWRGEAPLAAKLLGPLEWVFRAAQAGYHGAYDRSLLPRSRAPLPVISVGNLTVGGAGKTPVTRWLVERLQARGERPAVLHGGYASDEPALHRRWHPEIPVHARSDRMRSAKLALAEGATVAVLDDGFQHRRLRRDLDIVLIAAEHWTGHADLLPRGPWREPLDALRRAQLVAVTRKVASPADAEAVARQVSERAPHAAIMRISLFQAGWLMWGPGAQMDEPGSAFPIGVAVCAIADPDAFLQNARMAGARFDTALVFRDHHEYSRRDVARIRQAAGNNAVITTAKDGVKLARRAPDLHLLILEQGVRVEAGEPELDRELDRVLGAH